MKIEVSFMNTLSSPSEIERERKHTSQMGSL